MKEGPYGSNSWCVIVDIDGTLASCAWRFPLLREHGWDVFFDAMGRDAPIPSMVTQVRRYHDEDVPIMLVTGRPEAYRDVTQRWLEQHGVPWDVLVMRPDGDYRPSQYVKRDLLADIRANGWDPTMAWDDRDPDLEMYEREGVVTGRTDDPGLEPFDP